MLHFITQKLRIFRNVVQNFAANYNYSMRTRSKVILLIAAIIILLAWAPWITDEYAVNKVIEYFTKNPLPTNSSGNIATGNFMDIDGVPGVTKGDIAGVMWVPFAKFVTNVEGGFFVTFYGSVL